MEIRNITKKFGSKTVLSDFTLSIPEKGILFLTGPSGCGKTTLLRIIAKLEKPDSGNVEYSHIKKTAYVFQEARLLPHADATENVALPNGNTADTKTRAKELLTRLGLGNDLHTYPNEMSGGMKQRVSIARAFAFDSDMMLMDEPFTALDEKNRQIVYELIKEYAKDRPCVIVTHNKSDADVFSSKIIDITQK